MRKRRLRGGITALSVLAAIGMASGITAFAADGTQSEAANTGKGLEYVYESSGSTPSGVTLNGNSVIIKQSPNSTDSEQLLNIYNDKDRDGILDEGEEAFALDGSTDIQYGNIYGIYHGNGSSPISITIDGAELPVVYGAFESTVETPENMTAVTISVKGDAAVESLYGLFRTYCTGGVLIDTEKSVTIKTLYGLSTSTIDGDITENINYSCDGNTFVTLATDGYYTGKAYTINGDAVFNMNGAGISSVYIVQNGAVLSKTLTAKVTDSKVDNLCGVSQSAKVDGDVSLTFDGISAVKDGSSASVYGASSAAILGNLDLKLKSQSGSEMSVYGTNNTNIKGNVNVSVDGSGAKFNTIYGMYGGMLGGRADIDIKNCAAGYTTCGMNSVSFSQTQPEEEGTYTYTVNMENITGASGRVYGISNCSGITSASVVMKAVATTDTLNGMYLSTGVKGDIKAELYNCNAAYVNALELSNVTVNGSVDAIVSGCSITRSLNVEQGGSISKDLNISVSNVISSSARFVYGGSCLGNMTVNVDGMNDESIVDENGDPLVNSYEYAGSDMFTMMGNFALAGELKADIAKIHFAKCGLAGGDYSCGNIGTKVDITLSDSSINGLAGNNIFYLANESYSGSTENTVPVDIKINNTDFTNADGISFQMYIGNNKDAKVTFDDKCSMPEKYYMAPSMNTTGSSVITYGQNIYYGGQNLVIDKDVTADNIYFGNFTENGSQGNAVIVINKGVTLTAKEGIYAAGGSNILHSGILKGTFKATDGYLPNIFSKGGVIEDSAVGNVANVNYSLDVVSNEKAATYTMTGKTSQYIDPDGTYVKGGADVKITPTVNKGYILDKVTFRGQSDTAENSAVEANGVYTFSMPNEPCTVTIATTGKQIVVSKTTVDPSALLGKEYTAASPLYDMADLVISNDAREGEVTYEIDETNGLPEGLTLTDGKIVGTARKLYEDGKNVIVHVTGRNGSKAQLSLNVIVSNEEKKQDNQDGRIVVDEDEKTICLNGTSVVIQAKDDTETEIYVDDNQDGQADGKTPLYTGDLSEYTITGVEDNAIRRSIRITMTGGNVKAIYGAKDSELSYEGGDAVSINIRGGKAATMYVLSNSTVDGTIAYEIAKNTVDKGGFAADTTSKYTGAFMRNSKDIVTIRGTYVVNKKLTATALIIYDSAAVDVNAPVEVTDYVSLNERSSAVFNDTLTADRLGYSKYAKAVVNGDTKLAALNMTQYDTTLTIGEDALFDVGKVNMTSGWARVYQKGTLKCPSDQFSNTGVWVAAGKFADDIDASGWTGVYYSYAGASTNMDNTSAKLAAQSYVVEYENVKYVACKQAITVSYTDVPGYTAYVSANGGEPVQGSNGSAKVTGPDSSMSIVVDYVADQIDISKEYADPILAAETKYTADSPAYDLTILKVTGDTTKDYGTDMQYRLKSGSTLPSGLVLESGKITGTAKNAGESTVTFVITGRNGTSVDFPVVFKVLPAGTEIPDINKLGVSVNTEDKTIDLGGNSAVIIVDPSDSSKSSVYLDADHNGVADDNRPLRIDGEVTYDLSGYSISGYTDTANKYTGDISVTLRSGNVGNICAAGSTDSKADRVTIDGNVTMTIMSGYVSGTVAAAGNTDVKTVTFTAEDGRAGSVVYGAYNTNAEKVDFTFAKSAQMYTPESTKSENMYVTSGGSVSGDVDVRVGITDHYNTFIYGADYMNKRSYFNGVSGTVVSGNVNCVVEGRWCAEKCNNFVQQSDVKGDLYAEIKSGELRKNDVNNEHSKALVFNYGYSIGNIYVEAGTEGAVTGDFVLAAGGKVGKVEYVDENAKSTATVKGTADNYQVESLGSLYMSLAGKLTIGGDYTLDREVEVKQLEILKDSKLTIAEGAALTNTSTATVTGDVENLGTWNVDGALTMTGSLVNRGAWNLKGNVQASATVDNYGYITAANSERITLNTNAKLINRADAQFTFGNLTNSAMIVNYGNMKQLAYTSSLGSGSILTTVIPDMVYALKNYSVIFYKLDVDYPAYCFKDGDAKIEKSSSATRCQKKSGVDGDDALYIQGGKSFYITIDGEPIDGMAVDSVVFGPDDTAMTTSNNRLWSGVMTYEPATVTVNMAKQEAVNITLAKTEDTVKAQVGKTTTKDEPLYDLTAIEIQNDEAVDNGYVSYSLAKGQTLPAGLVIYDGKVYGTTKTASAEAQTVKFTVRGQNQTVAEFTLIISSVEKGIPSFTAGKAGDAYAGKTLADVELPTSAAGKYMWADGTQQVGKAGTSETYDAYFVPDDTANYDWSKIDAAEGTYEELEDGSVRIAVKLSVYVRKQDPVFTVPENVTATYGDTVGKILLPETAGGMFIWENADESVGEVGTKTFLATFVPEDEDVYERAEHVEITVQILPANAVFTQAIDSLSAKENMTLADIELPEREDGVYTWYTDRTTKVEDGNTYKLCFKPADTVNYDWTSITGWNRAYNGVVFNVKITIEKEPEQHVHDYGNKYKSDSKSHWYQCLCGEKSGLANHTWDKGAITTKPTDTAAGKKTFTCTKCGYKRYESVAALGIDIGNSKNNVVVSGIEKNGYTYTGLPITVKSLALRRGKTTLKNGVDYTVQYKNNKNIGTATVKITGKGNYRGSVSKTFAIKAGKGKIYKVAQKGVPGYLKYKVTNAASNGKGTVTLVGSTSKKSDKKFKSLTVASSVKIGGVNFNVTAVGAKAFTGRKYLTTVVIGGNVKTIGGAAFSKCGKLGKVTIKSTRITTIGKNAFQGVKSNVKIYLPKKKYDAYAKKLKAKGMNTPKKAVYKKSK